MMMLLTAITCQRCQPRFHTDQVTEIISIEIQCLQALFQYSNFQEAPSMRTSVPVCVCVCKTSSVCGRLASGLSCAAMTSTQNKQ